MWHLSICLSVCTNEITEIIRVLLKNIATLYLQSIVLGISAVLSMNVAEPYQPVQYHWFFNQQVDSKDSWQPFSREDSRQLEDAYSRGLPWSPFGYFKTYGCNCWKYSWHKYKCMFWMITMRAGLFAVGKSEKDEVVVATDGRRYDVRVRERKRYSVYWEQKPTEVRRCSWFHKGSKDVTYTPYSEELSEFLEVRGTDFLE